MIDPKDLEIFKAHLESFGAAEMVCPVCHSTTWIADGPHSAFRYGSDGALEAHRVVPVMLAVCDHCAFVREFAWIPITKKWGSRGG